MTQIRCQYCHEYVDSDSYAAHTHQHRQLRPDGQQNDYATLPPEERLQGSLEEVPQIYLHLKCQQMTQMPEEIVRSYLQNPYMYLADSTFCCGCSKQVPFSECIWIETDENLQEYMNRLRAAKPELRPQGCLITILWSIVCVKNWLYRQFNQ